MAHFIGHTLLSNALYCVPRKAFRYFSLSTALAAAAILLSWLYDGRMPLPASTKCNAE
jgi:hypothetical protein